MACIDLTSGSDTTEMSEAPAEEENAVAVVVGRA